MTQYWKIECQKDIVTLPEGTFYRVVISDIGSDLAAQALARDEDMVEIMALENLAAEKRAERAKKRAALELAANARSL